MKKGIVILFLIALTISCNRKWDNPNEATPDFTQAKGSFTDARDQKKYAWVRIGDQVWMAENLAYLPAVSPSNSGSETAPYYYVYYYVYDYEGISVNEAKVTVNYSTYGVLYNWPAANTSCPQGWYLPTDEEWKVLEKYLGMSISDADSYGIRESSSIGKKMKSTAGWNKNGNGDNGSGFTVLPGGHRTDDPGFMNLGYAASFWSSSDGFAPSFAWYRFLYFSHDGIERRDNIKYWGLSVRCLKI